MMRRSIHRGSPTKLVYGEEKQSPSGNSAIYGSQTLESGSSQTLAIPRWQVGCSSALQLHIHGNVSPRVTPLFHQEIH